MSTALSPIGENGKIKQLIESNRFKSAVASALPAHLKPERFIRVALTALTRTPKLAQCEQASFFQCLLTLSQFGLEPDGRNAHLIPFENRQRGVVECQVILDYKGLVDLAMRSGRVAYIHADKVCTNDQFEYDRGEIKSHKIDFKAPRGEAYAYYAICRFKDGTEKCEVMTKDEIEKIRQRSRAKDSGPWVTDFDEMGKKTVFRRLSKWIQLSPEFREALDYDADALEEHRFEAALPIQIERPRISAPATPASDGQPAEPKKRGRKPKVGTPPDGPKSVIPNTTVIASPSAIEIERRLKEGDSSVPDLLKVLIEHDFIDADEEWKDIGEEKLALFLGSWPKITNWIDEKRNAPKVTEDKLFA